MFFAICCIAVIVLIFVARKVLTSKSFKEAYNTELPRATRVARMQSTSSQQAVIALNTLDELARRDNAHRTIPMALMLMKREGRLPEQIDVTLIPHEMSHADIENIRQQLRNIR